ncbi:hypothetical protein BJAS_P0850 [Bathymodiolus japonicus methanotrophic gill symbiont]|uniref:hypothetical protein n=1 Tax=Bathymodiolus japonicus methanotrophic gill symbiont TaxID=113269 RepID=UPI001B790C82|nr:hypothetical protein [Bathymodiolus japonicus methanotrophic gill symbiont]GFO71404.1 hypothetical protein BJAS_P0850 [Bathymodiolus japonicus methanotrophic gill symbiont]
MTNSMMRKSFIALLGMLFSATLWAHGGAAGTDTDQCKFELEPEHWIHYTAYQPVAFPAEEFCGNLPNTDTLTQLVFDYQDVRYRNRAVEFEVTKEPEGKRVFFQAAKKHKSGTVVLKLANGVPEPGKYLIHITLKGATDADNLDAHMSFVAGKGMATSNASLFMYFLFALAGLYVLYLSHAGFKAKVDEILSKDKDV